MTRSFSAAAARRLVAASLLALTLGLSACGDDGGDESAGPAGRTPTEQPESAAVDLDKVADTEATAKAASAAKVPADELQEQIDAIGQGLEDGGFDANNVGPVGDAKADFVIDTSWAVYLYESERGAADFVLFMKDARSDDANYELFRIENRVYFASMTSALTSEDKAKLDEIAEAAEGAIAAR